jgi:hypothetical protein
VDFDTTDVLADPPATDGKERKAARSLDLLFRKMTIHIDPVIPRLGRMRGITKSILQRGGIRPQRGMQHRGDVCQPLNCPVLSASVVQVIL